eukprot:COSAG02_NODE_53_length_44062_cov_22.860223_29_plen_821_part_00
MALSPQSVPSPRSPGGGGGSPRFSFSPEGLAVLLTGSRPQRSAAYAALEGYVARRARDTRHAREGSATLAAGCIAPLAAVLSRPESEVDASEFRQCAQCIYGLVSLDAVAVGSEWLRDGRCWASVVGNNHAAGIAARQSTPEAITHEHVETLAAAEGCFAPLFVGGMEPVLAAAEVDDALGVRRECSARFTQCSTSHMMQMSTLLAKALREGALIAGEGLVVGAWQLMHTLCDGRPEVALHQVQMGVIEVAIAELRATPSGDWVSIERARSPGRFAAIWLALSTMTSHLSAERRQLLPGTFEGLLGVAIDTLRAYETSFNTPDANISVVYFALSTLKNLRSLPTGSGAYADALREAVSSLRFAVDHPLVYCSDLNMRTDAVVIDIAAELFGRAETGTGDPRFPSFEFQQAELEAFVGWRLKVLDGTAAAGTVPVESFDSSSVLSLSVSDAHRNMLMNCAKLVPMLVLGLFSDPGHPRGSRAVPPATPTPEYVQVTYQCNHAEAIYHLALCEAGRKLLIQHGKLVVEALQAVGSQGMAEEARTCALGALHAISLRATETCSDDSTSEQQQQQNHQNHRPRVFLSYHAGNQVVMQQISQSLLARGYCICDQQKDDELARCEVIVFGCSTRYKESPHCRAVAQLGQQLQKPMVALMLEHDCDVAGSWLGALLTTQQRWIAFHGSDILDGGEHGSLSERRVDALVREIEIAGRSEGRRIASTSQEQEVELSEAVPPSPSSISCASDGNASTDLTNAELGSKVRAMVIASLTEQELGMAARARGYSLVKVVDLIGALVLSCACFMARCGRVILSCVRMRVLSKTE